jgi:quinol monooxygenase YgiN
MSVVVLATLIPVPQHRAEVVAALGEAIAAVHAQDEGCELYALHEQDDRLVMIEKWSSPEAMAAHGQGAAIEALTPKLAGKLEHRVHVQVLRPHPAGTAEQGTL